MARVRAVVSGILVVLLSLPAEGVAQATAPQSPKDDGTSQASVLIATAVGRGESQAQATPQKPGQSGMGGIAGGIGAAPVFDAQKRPITAGGFVDSGPVVFEDVTRQAGLSGWVHKMGVPEKKFIVETNGSGVALLDYNNDGWLDITW